jgi:hypothetical protein
MSRAAYSSGGVTDRISLDSATKKVCEDEGCWACVSVLRWSCSRVWLGLCKRAALELQQQQRRLGPWSFGRGISWQHRFALGRALHVQPTCDILPPPPFPSTAVHQQVPSGRLQISQLRSLHCHRLMSALRSRLVQGCCRPVPRPQLPRPLWRRLQLVHWHRVPLLRHWVHAQRGAHRVHKESAAAAEAAGKVGGGLMDILPCRRPPPSPFMQAPG